MYRGVQGGISSSVLSVFFTDKFYKLLKSLHLIGWEQICQWKTLTKRLMKCPPVLLGTSSQFWETRQWYMFTNSNWWKKEKKKDESEGNKSKRQFIGLNDKRTHNNVHCTFFTTLTSYSGYPLSLVSIYPRFFCYWGGGGTIYSSSPPPPI